MVIRRDPGGYIRRVEIELALSDEFFRRFPKPGSGRLIEEAETAVQVCDHDRVSGALDNRTEKHLILAKGILRRSALGDLLNDAAYANDNAVDRSDRVLVMLEILLDARLGRGLRLDRSAHDRLPRLDHPPELRLDPRRHVRKNLADWPPQVLLDRQPI